VSAKPEYALCCNDVLLDTTSAVKGSRSIAGTAEPALPATQWLGQVAFNRLS
jgi:hypothetical protein